MRQALLDVHPVHRIAHKKLSFLEHPKPDENVANLYLNTEAGVLDVLGNVLGIGSYEELVKNAVEIPLFGRRVSVISLSDLIKAKEAVGREKDLLVAKELRAIAAKKTGR